MLYVLLGLAALAAYFWFAGRKPLLKRREWRILNGALALAAFTAAGYAGVRGGWAVAVVLTVIGLWLAASTRRTGTPPASASSGSMSLDEARRILGVGADASRDEIQAAYARLMRSVHPDRGGTAGLAAQLNAARDRLLSK
jgi:DnaJ-domain-containing protein 1